MNKVILRAFIVSALIVSMHYSGSPHYKKLLNAVLAYEQVPIFKRSDHRATILKLIKRPGISKNQKRRVAKILSCQNNRSGNNFLLMNSVTFFQGVMACVIGDQSFMPLYFKLIPILLTGTAATISAAYFFDMTANEELIRALHGVL